MPNDRQLISAEMQIIDGFTRLKLVWANGGIRKRIAYCWSHSSVVVEEPYVYVTEEIIDNPTAAQIELAGIEIERTKIEMGNYADD